MMALTENLGVDPTAIDDIVSRQRHPFFNVVLDTLTMHQTVEAARALIRSGGLHQHVVLNAAKIVAVDKDPKLAAIIRSCALVNADGQSIVWGGRFLGLRVPERVAGIDLFLELCRAAAADGSSIFLLGAEQAVVEQTAAELQRRFPGLIVAGVHNGFWTDDQEVIQAVRSVQPTYLFLAIPSPRKEFWLNEHLAELGVPFVMGVGGSFDVVAGKTTRAPLRLQRIGLEWTWRLLQEPRRMFKRYLVGNTKFLKLLWLERRRASS